MATARFDMRLDEGVKAKAEKAAALLGLKSLSDYVAKLMDVDATRVIAQHEGLMVDDDVFDRFIKACEETRKPNKALLDAAAFTREQSIK
ncbi:MAG: hypothetical protein A2511_03380 [Deltaproteobacteria bacterium RIFOXYD12_FULL_50_9]|nr:MAG: hypothetical protein A2511_03380 [Deltaproteobacteria bacterium RIFOXYD12_FULL_50_9]